MDLVTPQVHLVPCACAAVGCAPAAALGLVLDLALALEAHLAARSSFNVNV